MIQSDDGICSGPSTVMASKCRSQAVELTRFPGLVGRGEPFITARSQQVVRNGSLGQVMVSGELGANPRSELAEEESVFTPVWLGGNPFQDHLVF